MTPSVPVDPVRDPIRIGTLVPYGPDVIEYVRGILPHGFESIQLTFWQTLGDADLPDLARRLRAELEPAGARVSALGIYGNPLESGEADAATREGWSQLVAHAEAFGTDIVGGFTGRLRDQPIDASIPRFRDVFGDLARRAADAGVRLAFENCAMGGTWARGDWNIAHHPESWELMFDAVPDAHVGLEWEPCHQMIALVDPIPQIEAWGRRIFHVHGKDATIDHDRLRRHGIGGCEPFAWHRTPGFGDSDWTRIISDLRRVGFQGSIDIEGWHDPVYRDDLEMTGQVHALEHLKRCRGGPYVRNPS